MCWRHALECSILNVFAFAIGVMNLILYAEWRKEIIHCVYTFICGFMSVLCPIYMYTHIYVIIEHGVVLSNVIMQLCIIMILVYSSIGSVELWVTCVSPNETQQQQDTTVAKRVRFNGDVRKNWTCSLTICRECQANQFPTSIWHLCIHGNEPHVHGPDCTSTMPVHGVAE